MLRSISVTPVPRRPHEGPDRASPGIERDEPVSRQHEAALAAHYGIATYMPSAASWAPVPAEGVDMGTATDEDAGSVATSADGDPHLRSLEEVDSYGILGALTPHSVPRSPR